MNQSLESVVKTYFAAFCNFDGDAWVGLFAEDGSLGGPAHTPAVVGRPALRGMFDAITGLFISIDFRPETILSEGNYAVAHFSLGAEAKNGRTVAARGFLAFAIGADGLLSQVAGFWNPGPVLATATQTD